MEYINAPTQAPAGGAVSPLNGEFYKGGQFMCNQFAMPKGYTKHLKRAVEKRTRIVNGYLAASKLQAQMYTGADQYITYGFLPIRVEPDYERQRPHITLENPLGAYPEFDRWGNCSAYFRRIDKTVDELCALFPEYEGAIRGSGGLATNGSARLELIRWVDDAIGNLTANHCIFASVNCPKANISSFSPSLSRIVSCPSFRWWQFIPTR